ncbi:MAG: ABC transporter substrate-binding protein [Oscillospiraceae bacterium]|nr:ABC transporter substrate-binding protein [Oscillospiraceae bacterium]
MKKRMTALILALAMALSLLAGCGSAASSAAPASSAPAPASSAPASSQPAPQEETITVTDHMGREVTLPAQIDRIVVTDIYPLASALTVFLGSAEKIVGIHPMSMSAAKSGILGEIFPEILEADTSFMTGTELNVESLLALEPDVVFCNGANTDEIEAITNAGIPCVGVATGKWKFDVLETYDQWIALLSQIFPESDKMEKVSQKADEAYEKVQTVVANIPEEERKDVLFLYSYDESKMVTSSSKFFGQFWCDALGCTNVAQDVPAEASNAVITMEQVYEWDPDIIFITNFTACQPEDLFNNAINGDDWSSVSAVKNGQVFKMPLGTYRTYTPSSDAALTLLWLAQRTYPLELGGMDLEVVVQDYYRDVYGVELTEEQVAAMYNPTAAAAANAK